MNRFIRSFLLSLPCIIILASCKSTHSNIESSKTVVMEVAPQTDTCYTWYTNKPQQCLKVKEDINNEEYKTMRLNQISGFIYEPGYLWTLKVKKIKLKVAPADAGDTQYQLIKILKKEKQEN